MAQPMPTGTYLGTTTTNANKYSQELIRRDLEELLRTPDPHLLAGHYVDAPFNGSNGTLRFLAIPDFAVTTGTPTPGTKPWLTEGQTPDVETVALAYEEMVAYQAGEIHGFTDQINAKSVVDLLSATSNRSAEQMMRTSAKYAADIIVGGTNVKYAGAATSTATVAATHILTSANVRTAVAALSAAGVPRFPDGYYRAIIHPYAANDIMADAAAGNNNWVDAHRYAEPSAMLSGEIGSYAGVRFLQSNHAAVKLGAGVGGTVNVYSTTFFGPRFFAFGDFGSAIMRVAPAGGKSDLLEQRFEVGWKIWIGARLLEAVASRYIRYESAATGG